MANTNEYPKGFNWGAFLMNWIWGIGHGKYITLLYFPACIIPIIGPLLISVWFGIEGNKWGYESRNWNSIDEFNQHERLWVRVWFIMAILGIILTLKLFVILAILGSHPTV